MTENLFKCKNPDCDSQDFYIKQVGDNKGLFCQSCDKYIKWLGKDEVRRAEKYIAHRSSIPKQQVIEMDDYRIVITPLDITLFHRGAAIVQKKIDQSLFIGRA